uniref:Uncharacterized protein n=1 Tax=Panagrolaimus sp. ES5 TaxID=591445 RepID=A0AC34GXF9_9BILA
MDGILVKITMVIIILAEKYSDGEIIASMTGVNTAVLAYYENFGAVENVRLDDETIAVYTANLSCVKIKVPDADKVVPFRQKILDLFVQVTTPRLTSAEIPYRTINVHANVADEI